jgi:hypothetical protein
MDAMYPSAVGSPSPQRIRWGAVFSGAVIGLALLALLTTLWFALAYGSNVDVIRTNLEWFVGVSAIACLFLAGMMAGWLSGVNGAGSGFFNGVTIWGLMLIATVSVGVPAILNVFNLGITTNTANATGGLLQTSDSTVLWATFASILGGLVAAGLGGMIGGAITRPANAHLIDTDTPVMQRETTTPVVDREPVVERETTSPVYEREPVMDRPTRPDIDDRERTVVVTSDDDTEDTDVRRVS